MPLRKGVTRFVLEGAPGQGKSTVTQYLCQVNRLRVLDKSRELERVGNDYRSGMIRAPLRLDLRDYAVWINGRHPYSADGVIPASVRSNPSLESFLAMQISWESGASPITEDELLQFLERSHCVIVLDGFDEVADIDNADALGWRDRECGGPVRRTCGIGANDCYKPASGIRKLSGVSRERLDSRRAGGTWASRRSSDMRKSGRLHRGLTRKSVRWCYLP